MTLEQLQNTPIDELKFCIVDTETTGMYAEFNKIMDIGIVTVKGNKIIDKWEALIDPKQPVPYWITKYTNLKTRDVKGQPEFFQIVDQIKNKLDQSIFVAHNLEFDYSFLFHEFRRTEQRFSPPSLCTVKLSRKLIPEVGAANLDALSAHFNIEIEARHRALPDAEATAIILIELIKRAKRTHNVRNFFDLEKLQRINLSKEIISNRQTSLL